MNLTQDRKALAAMAAAVVLSGALVSTLVLRTSNAAFTASTTNGADDFKTGVVTLTTSSPGVALFDLNNVGQGLLDGAQSVTRCLTVTWNDNTTGPDTRDIRMYLQNVSGAGTLAPYLNLSVNSAPLPAGAVSPDCVTIDGTHTKTYASLGGSQAISTANSPVAEVGAPFTLATAGTNDGAYSTGLTGWATATPNTSMVYEITVTVEDTNLAQGLNATADLVWEAK